MSLYVAVLENMTMAIFVFILVMPSFSEKYNLQLIHVLLWAFKEGCEDIKREGEKPKAV